MAATAVAARWCAAVVAMATSSWSGGRSGGGSGGGGTDACGGSGDGGWTPSPTFREQPLEMEETHFFSQMTARVCGGVPSPLIEPKMGREEKGPTRGPQPKT